MSVTVQVEDDSISLDPVGSWRPSLVKLTKDVETLSNALLRGFTTRREILEWEQALCVATFGLVSNDFYEGIARGFLAFDDGTRRDPPVLAVLKTPAARRGCRLEPGKARWLRERMVSRRIFPAYQKAFRQLRKDAGEYVDSQDYDPSTSTSQQRYRAMRPALDELAEWQEKALRELLAGFDSTAGILEWGETLPLASHGEVDPVFMARCHDERSTALVLTGHVEHAASTRLAFAARYVIPLFNEGAAVLSGRAGELPDQDKEPQEATPV